MMSDAIEESLLKRNPREGWAKDGQRFAEAGDNVPVWPHDLRGRRHLIFRTHEIPHCQGRRFDRPADADFGEIAVPSAPTFRMNEAAVVTLLPRCRLGRKSCRFRYGRSGIPRGC